MLEKAVQLGSKSSLCSKNVFKGIVVLSTKIHFVTMEKDKKSSKKLFQTLYVNLIQKPFQALPPQFL